MGSIARQQILDMVRQVVLTEIGDEPVKVYLFGSWARGEEHISSDIDIAVDSIDGVHLENLARLREALEESAVPYRVDVVDLAEAAKILAAKVRKEGIVWKG
ncbi:Nucleotidyltransferase domain protein [Sporomusa ovata DSM 2662]|uniref:Probable nucleotidyltransferase n=1 Tax=Sporomusa ovata TaxID=2378 RepID=A0A0U1KT44_9FIRM|nr:nucleotidyltransferase domain-containing protein [Sporomusa ovata]EQB26346.1 putative nucleotidyltransferase [Sporomusa ovata DSM 2662]CQR70425.1 probable nucleotidyltransferase [Sporomusa ovata]